MIKVTLRNNESLESLIRRFNSEVIKDGILKRVKEKSFYEKPSIKKRKKALERRMEKKI
jgi:small subunit ribosomal protein S21